MAGLRERDRRGAGFAAASASASASEPSAAASTAFFAAGGRRVRFAGAGFGFSAAGSLRLLGGLGSSTSSSDSTDSSAASSAFVGRFARVGLSASASAVIGWVSPADVASTAKATPSVTATMRTLSFLPTSLRGVGDDDLVALHLPNARPSVVEADLAELQLELLADLDRRVGRELLDRALLEQTHVVEVDVLDPDEEEPALGQLLELLETRAVGPDEQADDLRADLDLEGLGARARA